MFDDLKHWLAHFLTGCLLTALALLPAGGILPAGPTLPEHASAVAVAHVPTSIPPTRDPSGGQQPPANVPDPEPDPQPIDPPIVVKPPVTHCWEMDIVQTEDNYVPSCPPCYPYPQPPTKQNANSFIACPMTGTQ